MHAFTNTLDQYNLATGKVGEFVILDILATRKIGEFWSGRKVEFYIALLHKIE